MTQKLKTIFMGTPEFSVAALRNLIANPRIDLVAVYTQPPRPAGRGQQLQPSPIQLVADEHHIPVYTPKSFKKDAEAVTFFQSLHADIAVVAAYGLILPKSVLDAPKYGCLNIHASLLPRWRGAAPIQRAIQAGDVETGITIMQMEEGLDTGPMLLKKAVNIHITTTAKSLHDELSALGSVMIEDVLELVLDNHSPHPVMQDDRLSCYAPMLKKEEGFIDWIQPAEIIDRQIRAFTPWPGCYTFDSNGKRIKILSGEAISTQSSSMAGIVLTSEGDISCGSGIYRITLLQPENSKPMDVKSAINGKKISIGDKWGHI
jgi:methionyl-tRNA formyltransferase